MRRGGAAAEADTARRRSAMDELLAGLEAVHTLHPTGDHQVRPMTTPGRTQRIHTPTTRNPYHTRGTLGPQGGERPRTAEEIRSPFDFFTRTAPKHDWAQHVVTRKEHPERDNATESVASLSTVHSMTSRDHAATREQLSNHAHDAHDGAVGVGTIRSGATQHQHCRSSEANAWVITASSSSNNNNFNTTGGGGEGSVVGVGGRGEEEGGTMTMEGDAREVPFPRRSRRDILEYRAKPVPRGVFLRPLGVDLPDKAAIHASMRARALQMSAHHSDVAARRTLRKHEKTQRFEEKQLAKQQRIEQMEREREHGLRVMTILEAVAHAVALQRFATALESHRRMHVLSRHSTTIQRFVKRQMNVSRFVHISRAKVVLNRLIWRIKLWLATARRRLSAIKIRRFLRDFADGFLGYVILNFRYKVLKLQRHTRSFLWCKAARVEALRRRWRAEEGIFVKELKHQKQAQLMAQRASQGLGGGSGGGGEPNPEHLGKFPVTKKKPKAAPRTRGGKARGKRGAGVSGKAAKLRFELPEHLDCSSRRAALKRVNERTAFATAKLEAMNTFHDNRVARQGTAKARALADKHVHVSAARGTLPRIVSLSKIRKMATYKASRRVGRGKAKTSQLLNVSNSLVDILCTWFLEQARTEHRVREAGRQEAQRRGGSIDGGADGLEGDGDGDAEDLELGMSDRRKVSVEGHNTINDARRLIGGDSDSQVTQTLALRRRPFLLFTGLARDAFLDLYLDVTEEGESMLDALQRDPRIGALLSARGLSHVTLYDITGASDALLRQSLLYRLYRPDDAGSSASPQYPPGVLAAGTGAGSSVSVASGDRSGLGADVDTVDRDLARRNGVSVRNVKELREIFELVDDDKGGTITPDELGRLFDLMGYPKTQFELQHFLADIDSTGTDQLQFKDFANFLLSRKEVEYRADDVVLAFHCSRPKADRGASRRHISRAALMHTLTHFGDDRMSEAEASALVDRCEVFTAKSPTQFDFETYVRVMMMRAVHPSQRGRSGHGYGLEEGRSRVSTLKASENWAETHIGDFLPPGVFLL